MTPTSRRIVAVVLFAALAGVAFLFRDLLQQLPEGRRFVPEMAPLAIGAVGLGLALWFHRSRVVFALLVLAGTYVLLLFGLPREWGGQEVLLTAVGLLAPLNLGIFPFLRDRGIWTFSGLGRLFFLLAQLGVLAWGIDYPEGPIGSFLRGPWGAPGSLAFTGIPLAVLILYGVATLLLLGRWLVRDHPLDGGFLGALVATLPALHLQGEIAMVVTFWGLAVLVLTVSLVQESYRLAFMDELTGLPGRRALEEQLQRLGSGYVIAMMDVDHFKKFNDTYGHDAGDQVLRMVGAHLRRVGGGGRTFRYGGEEFTVLFPGRTMDEAAEAIDEVRQSIASAGFRVRESGRPKGEKGAKKRGKGGGKGVKVTVSAGLAERKGDRTNPQEVIKAADEALYKAKEQGRNCVAR